MKFALPIALLATRVFMYPAVAQTESQWEEIDDGLGVASFLSPVKSVVGDSKITVVRIDPRKYRFKLLCSSELGHSSLPISEWCTRYSLIGGVNAGMFQTDHRSNVGFMKNYQHLNNSSKKLAYNSVALFEPLTKKGALFRIVDTDATPFKDVVDAYNIVIQNLRLIKHPGTNCWKESTRRWSEVALGEDRRGNVLLIFSQSPYSMFLFNKILLQLPIDLVAAQHLEGGPEASLFLSWNGKNMLHLGSYETGFLESVVNDHEWPIPNVLGFVRRAVK